MSLRSFKLSLGILAGLLAVLACITVYSLLIGYENQADIEINRDVVERVDTSCARGADRTLPDEIRRAANKDCADTLRDAERKRSLSDTCIAPRKYLTAFALANFTRCENKRVINQARAGQNPGRNPNGSETVNPVGGSPDLSDSPGNGTNVPPVSTPPDTDAPNNPPSGGNGTDTPEAPEPTPPVTPPSTPDRPTLSVPGVSVDLSPDGTCLNALGVALGDCGR